MLHRGNDSFAGDTLSDEEFLSRYGWAARSYAVLVAWAGSEITEQQATELLGITSDELHRHVNELSELVAILISRKQATGLTVEDDLLRELRNEIASDKLREPQKRI